MASAPNWSLCLFAARGVFAGVFSEGWSVCVDFGSAEAAGASPATAGTPRASLSLFSDGMAFPPGPEGAASTILEPRPAEAEYLLRRSKIDHRHDIENPACRLGLRGSARPPAAGQQGRGPRAMP